MPTIPASVGELNKAPYPFGKYKLGTKINQLVEFARELHVTLSTGGALMTLVNGIRAELIAGGQLAERLIDLEDKAYNQMLVDPGWAQDGVVATDVENVNQIDGIVDGVYIAAIVAAGVNLTPAGTWDTGVGETRIITVSATAAGVVTATPSAIDATIAPRGPTGEMGIGMFTVPASFVAGVSLGGVLGFVDGFPRRLAVHTPIATADVAPIVAPAGAAIVGGAVVSTPETLPTQLPEQNM